MATLPPCSLPFLLMKLMMPPGELVARVEAEPPRTTSRWSSVESILTKLSGVVKLKSPNCSTGKPSSWICT